MSVQEPSASTHPPPSIRERTPSPSNSFGDAPTVDPPPRKKTAGKKKAPKRKAAKTKLTEPADPPAPQRAQHRYEPYRKASPTPEREADLPADPEELETLDATAKMLYKSDREVLEYINSIRRRTAAMLEHVNQTDSQLRSSKGAMERIQLFVGQWQTMDDRWTREQLSGCGETNALDCDEFDGEVNVPGPGLPSTPTRDKGSAFSTIKDHLSKHGDHTDFPHAYTQDFLGGSTPRPSNNDNEQENFPRAETLPVRHPSLPPSHEDEDILEYVEDTIGIHPKSPDPLNQTALASNESTLGPSVVSLGATPSAGETTGSVAALATWLPANPLHHRHPLAQSYVPSSSPGLPPQPEPQHLVVPHPIPRTPSPPRRVLIGKRKRVPTPEEEEFDDVGNLAGPSTIFLQPNISHRDEARNNEDRVPPKKRRLMTHQTLDSRMFSGPVFAPAPPYTNPPTSEGSLDPSSKSARRQAPLPFLATSRVRKEDSELERSQVIEMLSNDVEQGESGDEDESTGDILRGLSKSQQSLPALTADNTQASTTADTQPQVETPAESQVPTKVPASIPEDVFGPIVLSAKASKISKVLEKDTYTDRDLVMSYSKREATKSPSKSTQLSFSNIFEEEHRVLSKPPIGPGALQTEDALATEVEAESQDVLNPLSPPKKKRAIGARARKPKSSFPIGAGSAVNPEDLLPSISAGKPPPKLRRGRSASVQPEAPAPPKTPAKRPTRSKK